MDSSSLLSILMPILDDSMKNKRQLLHMHGAMLKKLLLAK